MIVDVTIDHMRELFGAGFRPEDRREWETATGQPAERVLAAALADPQTYARAILWGTHGRCIGIFGVTEGSVWLMGSPLNGIPMNVLAYEFFKTHRAEVAAMHSHGGSVLTAVADNRNLPHHRWLRTMGFIREEEWLTSEGHPYTVYRRYEHQCADH